jgi:hypothetical protein
LNRYSTFERLWADLQESNNWVPTIDGKRWTGNLSEEVIAIRRESLNRLLSGIITSDVTNGDRILPRYFRKGKAAAREPSPTAVDDDEDALQPVSQPTKMSGAAAAAATQMLSSGAAAPVLVTCESDEEDDSNSKAKRFYTSEEAKKAELAENRQRKQRQKEEKKERRGNAAQQRTERETKQVRQSYYACFCCFLFS